LVRLYPAVAAVSCGDCQTFAYSMPQATVGLVQLPGGTSERQPRAPGSGTPCRRCPKIPRGADPKPSSAVEWSERYQSAHDHWRECRAVGETPNDPVVRWYARLFHDADESVDDAVLERRHAELLVALSRRK
jgi:hypothetical protein